MEKYSLAERVLGVSDPNEKGALRKAHNFLTGLTLDTQTFNAECARLDERNTDTWKDIPVETQEHITTLQILRQIFEEGHIKYSNVLQHWPMYEAYYNRIKSTAQENQTNRKALQIGCLTALSSAAFTALAQDVYQAKPVTIDLTTSSRRARHGGYFVADALELGVANNSIHLAQTNCLLHMLRSNSNEDITPEEQAMQLFREVYRVVQPGGSIILREVASGLDNSEHPTYDSKESRNRFDVFKEEVFTGLARAGFTAILMEPATEIKGVDYLFNPNRRFEEYEAYERPATIVVCASKPI